MDLTWLTGILGGACGNLMLGRLARRLRAGQVVSRAELIDRLEIPYPIRVVGTSQGGSIGACFTADNPGKVDKLALLAPFFDDFEGSDSVTAKLVKTPFVGEVMMQLLPDAIRHRRAGGNTICYASATFHYHCAIR